MSEQDNLIDALDGYLEAQDALDNRELEGPNATPHGVAMQRRNEARSRLDSAITAYHASLQLSELVLHPTRKCLEAMERQGGSFVRSWSDCYMRADAPNKNRLAGAFQSLIHEYELKAKLL